MEDVARESDRTPILITEAETSQDDQHRERVRKYLAMMAIRIPALVIAGIVYATTGSGLWALAIVAVSIPIPWMAVLIANDRPPRRRGEVPRYKYAPRDTGPQGLGAPRGRFDFDDNGYGTYTDASHTDGPFTETGADAPRSGRGSGKSARGAGSPASTSTGSPYPENSAEAALWRLEQRNRGE
ncbi:hypothetical protein GCM10027169_37960 [Gordonia jinhuaensis]|uniref:DUF3099 domain-containing protein n=1 Tax=Gordonia jinhuaensis TaxID=1517702 RepID=A0A916WSM9_9ACTN|nr:hypothetical protein GCM10011489_12470 [Gordonia jinhuaensis]